MVGSVEGSSGGSHRVSSREEGPHCKLRHFDLFKGMNYHRMGINKPYLVRSKGLTLYLFLKFSF